MTYYPIEVMSRDQVPLDALHVVPGQLLTNFRRTAPLPDGQVKVVDLGDVIPGLH